MEEAPNKGPASGQPPVCDLFPPPVTETEQAEMRLLLLMTTAFKAEHPAARDTAQLVLARRAGVDLLREAAQWLKFANPALHAKINRYLEQ